jgi:hypothetical protein
VFNVRTEEVKERKIDSEQAGSINNYQHTKLKMIKTNAAVWFSRRGMTEARQCKAIPLQVWAGSKGSRR